MLICRERAKIRSRVEYSYDDRGKKIGPKTAQPPLNITIYKGELHMAVTRGFVEFVLTDERPRILADWMRDTHVPDENYFTTINYNYEVFQAPGAKPGEDAEGSLVTLVTLKWRYLPLCKVADTSLLTLG